MSENCCEARSGRFLIRTRIGHWDDINWIPWFYTLSVELYNIHTVNAANHCINTRAQLIQTDYNDVTYESRLLKSTEIRQFVSVDTKEKNQSPSYGLIRRVIHRWSVDFLYEWPFPHNAFPSHDVIRQYTLVTKRRNTLQWVTCEYGIKVLLCESLIFVLYIVAC